jgi:hypothetical protein
VSRGETSRTDPQAKDRTRRIIDWALEFDQAELRWEHREFVRSYRKESREHLARRLIAGTSWKTGGIGVAAGIPASPFSAVPASVADVAVCLRMEARMVARIALLFNERYFEARYARYEVLIPMLGEHFERQFRARCARQGTTQTAGSGFRQLLTHELLSELKQSALTYVLAMIAERAVVANSLPIIGGVIGGSWNFVQTHVVGWRSYKYFRAAHSSRTRELSRCK